MNVLITGAASGLGLATANYFASNNNTVISCDIIMPPKNNNVICYQVDITKEEEINNLKEELTQKNITLDIIINFAGIYDMGSFLEKDLKQIKRLIDINLLGPININQILYPLLAKKGKIIIITSEVASLDPMPFNGIYNVSKTALDCYAQSLRQELNLLGQKVITIRPGAFNTNLAKGSLLATEELAASTMLYKKQANKFLKLVKMFMGTPMHPDKLAKLIYKVSLKKNPKYIYSKHRNIGLVLLNILPKRMQCFIIKQLLKVKKKDLNNNKYY